MNAASPDSSPTGLPLRKISLVRRLGSRWMRLHLLWKILTVAAALLILASPFYGPARKVHRTWNYENDLAAAKQALADGRYVEARDLSLAVLRGDPGKIEALPIFMRAAEEIADPRLVGVARGYLSLNSDDKTERVFAWKSICRQSPMGIAGSTWMSLQDDEKTDPDFLAPWLERLENENLSAEVATMLAGQAELTDPRLVRIQLSMLAKRGTEVSYRDLQARLLERLASHPDEGPLLLEAMDEIPQAALIPYFFTALGEWLKARGGEPSVEDQLRLARCEMAARPETSEAVFSRMIDRLGGSDPLPVARFCAILKRFGKVEELLEPLVAKGDSGAFDLMAEVLERLDKLDKWDKLLETPPRDAFLPGILCDRAFLASNRGDQRAQPKFEQEAIAAAVVGMKNDSLIRLARHADDRGLHTFATAVWVKAIRMGPSSPLPAFSSVSHVVESLAHHKKESELLDVLTVYHALEPGNLDVVTQYLYLACLHGSVTPARVLADLSPIREKIQSLPLDCTVAFAHVLEGNYPVAAKLTGNREVDWFAQIPALRAIRAIVLAKTGGREEADVYMDGFPWDGLLPSEIRVFRELLDEPEKAGELDPVAKAEKFEKARTAEVARQANKAKEAKAARDALEVGKTEETKKLEKFERAEHARRAEQARQAKRIQEAEAAKEAR